MKTFQIMLVATIIAVISISTGLVYALDSNELSAQPILSEETLNPGDTVTVRINLQSNTNQQLQIQQIGIHFDWMPTDGFYGPNLSSNPVTIQSNGIYTSPPFIVQVPSNTTAGPHDYFVGVDGLEGTDQTVFSWNSPELTIQIFSGSTQSTPTPTPTITSGGGEQTQSPLNLLLYGTVIAVVTVVVIAVIVTLIGRKRRQVTPVVDQPLKTNEDQT